VRQLRQRRDAIAEGHPSMKLEAEQFCVAKGKRAHLAIQQRFGAACHAASANTC